jgi:predicted ATP-grasp superfamily ATP-dependent carboligase
MRLLVFEFITGGGLLHEALPQSLAAEGDQMLRALAADLALIPFIDTVLTRDDRLPRLKLPVTEIRLDSADHFPAVWQRLLRDVDAVWPIAPESDGLLQRLSDDIVKAGKILVGSSPDSVELTASKRRTLIRLAEQGIKVVPTYGVRDTVPPDAARWVVKPDDGVGCQGIRLLHSLEQARQCAGDGIIQPYLEGMDLSLSMICNQGETKLLSVNRQRIRRIGDTLQLDGCDSGIVDVPRQPLQHLASEIARIIPGLWGYVGVDLMYCDQEYRVLEINPRLTTSYASLPRGSGFNPAGEVLKLIDTLASEYGSGPQVETVMHGACV